MSSGAFAQQMAITGATIIDGTGKPPVSDGVVLIADGRITAVGGLREVAIPKGAKRFDARGKYVVPGLMDANVHLMSYALEALTKYEDRYHEIVLEGAQIALQAGQTTVFDTWGPRAPLVKARDMINAGKAPGSRIYLAGNIIGFDGPVSADFWADWAQHTSKAFSTRINEMWEQGTGRELLWLTPDEVRSAVREYAQKDVDFLKYGAADHAVFTHAEVQPGSFVAFSPRVQRVIVEEGHRAGMTVQAHVMSVESLDLAIAAGVDIVTHGDWSGPMRTIPEETIQKLVERGVAVSVIPITQRHLAVRNKHAPGGMTPYLNIAKANRRNMIKAGVTLLLSTDVGISGPVDSQARAESPMLADTISSQWTLGEAHFDGMAALEEEGMDRMEILKSATSNIAKAYKLDAKLGTLEPNKTADVVVLDANPLESVRNYRRIHAVIKDGKVVDRGALPVAPVLNARAMAN